MAGKSDESEVVRRVEVVLQLLLDGWQHHEIRQYVAEQKWEIEDRQLRTYIARAHELMVEQLDKKRMPMIARHVAQRERLYKKCLDAEDHKTALAVLQDIAKLRGLYPEKSAKELAKLVVAQGVKIEELERRIRDAARTTPTQDQEAGPQVGGTGSSTPESNGPALDVED